MLHYIALLTCLVFLSGCEDNRPVEGIYPTVGLASWYSGHRTATGEWFNKNELTCAMRRGDFGKYYKVCNTQNSRCVIVRHNNFGPALRLFKNGRIVDLSKAAFAAIADLKAGIIPVTISEE